MDRPNLGFVLFLGLLLIAPEIPAAQLSPSVNASVSLAAAGLVVWLMLAPRLPLRVVLAMPTVLGLIGFSIYVLLVSLASGRLVSIAYASQYAFYAVLAGTIIPAYLVHKMRQGRQTEVWRILAWVGAIYVGGIILSVWTGPIYPSRVESISKHYGHFVIPRAFGFSESVNAAGGIAALLAAFYLFLYRSSRRLSIVLPGLSVAALVLTLSRSAIAAFALAICVVAAILAFRAVCLRGRLGSLRLRLVPVALVLLGIVAGVVTYQQPIVAAAWERLVLDEGTVNQDVDIRLAHWKNGIARWTDQPLVQQVVGAGFRSAPVGRGGVLLTSHNVYIEMLNDLGIIGLLIFLGILMVALMRLTRLILLDSNNNLAKFSLVGLIILILHNHTQVFFYEITIAVFLILLLTCGELAEGAAHYRHHVRGADRVRGHQSA